MVNTHNVAAVRKTGALINAGGSVDLRVAETHLRRNAYENIRLPEILSSKRLQDVVLRHDVVIATFVFGQHRSVFFVDQSA